MAFGFFAIALMMQPVPATTGIVEGSPPTADGDGSVWVVTDDYPETAWAERREGVTEVRLSVDSTGRAIGCTISRSSAHADLDTAACAALMQRARFLPARDGEGRAVAGEYVRRVRWQLPGSDGPYRPGTGAIAGGVRLLRVHVRQDGEVDFCSVHDGTFPVPADVHADVCSEIPSGELIWARAVARIRPGGVWVELVWGGYMFDTDPGWPVEEALRQPAIRVVDTPAPPPQ